MTHRDPAGRSVLAVSVNLLGRDSQSSFPQNADLDPKIEECSSNLTLPHPSQSFRATKLAHEKPSKGLSKFVRTLRMLGRRVIFGLAREPLSVITYYLLTYTN